MSATCVIESLEPYYPTECDEAPGLSAFPTDAAYVAERNAGGG